jgi:hypothetical protein
VILDRFIDYETTFDDFFNREVFSGWDEEERFINSA